MSFVKNVSFKPTLNSLTANNAGVHHRCRGRFATQCSSGLIGYYELFEIWWSLTIRALWVRRRTFISILDFTRSQCREANTGEIGSLILVLVSTFGGAAWYRVPKPFPKSYSSPWKAHFQAFPAPYQQHKLHIGIHVDSKWLFHFFHLIISDLTVL